MKKYTSFTSQFAQLGGQAIIKKRGRKWMKELNRMSVDKRKKNAEEQQKKLSTELKKPLNHAS